MIRSRWPWPLSTPITFTGECCTQGEAHPAFSPKQDNKTNWWRKNHEVKFKMKINNKQTKDQKTPRTDIWGRHEIQMCLDCCLFLTCACHPWGGFNKLQVFTSLLRRSLIRYLVCSVAKPLTPAPSLKSSINCAPLPITRPWHSLVLYLLLAPTEMSQF